MNKAIFLDRDGTINVDKGYTHKPEDLEFGKNAIEGLKTMSQLGYKLIVITNQSGISRKYFTEKEFRNFMDHMIGLLRKNKVKIDKYYFCPHIPEDNCRCRKPKTQLVQNAIQEFKIDVKKSFFVGDKTIDIQTGKSVGCKTILVKTNHRSIDEKSKPDFIVEDLVEASDIIIKLENSNIVV